MASRGDGGTVVASLLTTAWYVSVAAPAMIRLARCDLMKRLTRPALAALMAFAVNARVYSCVGPLAAAIVAAGIAILLVIANGALILSRRERYIIRHVLFGSLSNSRKAGAERA
jgi:hypothetical protein